MTKAIFAICLLMLCGCEETIEWTNVSHNFPRHCPPHTTAISSRPIMWLWEGEKEIGGMEAATVDYLLLAVMGQWRLRNDNGKRRV